MNQPGFKPGRWEEIDDQKDQLIPSLKTLAGDGRAQATAVYDRGGPGVDRRKNPHKANAAAGLLTIWNNNGSLLFNNPAVRLGYPGFPHSEELIINWAVEKIDGLKQNIDGGIINLLIYSYTDVCPDCERDLPSVWLDKLRAASERKGGAVINLDVWDEKGGSFNHVIK